MKSLAGESVPLKDTISVDDEIENWLGFLSRNMQQTLQVLLLKCLKESTLEIGKYPSQILNLSEEITFNMNCSKALQGGNLKQYKQELQGKLEKYTSSQTNNHLVHLKLKALILDLIHQIEVVDLLISNNVRDPNDWLWFKQLKFWLKSQTKLAKIAMCQGDFDYTYEY